VPPSPFWDAGRHRDRRPFLIKRARIQAALRAWFARAGFVEVEAAVVQVSPGNEAHLHAFATELIAPDGARRQRYLRTSPEFAMKKLLAAGESRIVDFARVFRNRERTPLHAPEFTLVEWYRAREPYEAIMADAQAVIGSAARVVDGKELGWRGRTADPFAAPEKLTVGDAFHRHAGIDLDAVDGDRDAFAAAAQRQGIRIAADDTWSDVFSRVLSERVEPHLGIGRPTILYEYPVAEAALARVSPSNSKVAERFEVYACGVELANGFAELTDAAEQRRRFQDAMDVKQARYGERYPIDEDFLAALGKMPPASGVALGFDRLVMLLTGATNIADVQWSPLEDHS
jgi:elongation factor P--(R)-beta-lysine ligase